MSDSDNFENSNQSESEPNSTRLPLVASVSNEELSLEFVSTSANLDINNPLNDRNYVKQLIESNDTHLRYVSQTGKSVAWNRFERIFYDDIETIFVKCKHCKTIQKNVQSGGTGGLLRHRCLESDSISKTADECDSDDRQVKKNLTFEEILLLSSRNELPSDEDLTYLLDDRNYIKHLIDTNDSNLRFKPQQRKSIAWDKFERVFYNEFETLFVKCKYCDNIQKCNNSIGTGGLLRHRCVNTDGIPIKDSLFFNKIKLNDKTRNNCNSKSKTHSFGELLLLSPKECESGSSDNAFSLNDKSCIKKMIENNDSDLHFESQSGKSSAWNRFERIYYKEFETMFVKCKYCDNIQKCDHTTGTGGLLRHRCPESDSLCVTQRNSLNICNEIIRENNNYIYNATSCDEQSLVPAISGDTSFLINDRNFIKEMIDTYSPCLRFEKHSGKSAVWDRFERVFYNDVETLFVKCKSCSNIQKCDNSTGTGGALRHRCPDGSAPVDYKNAIVSYKKIFGDNLGVNVSKDGIHEENRKLRELVIKCLSILNKCKCFNSDVVSERKHINKLVSNYNNHINNHNHNISSFENHLINEVKKECDDNDDNNDELNNTNNNESENNSEKELNDDSGTDQELANSDEDSDYVPNKSKKKKKSFIHLSNQITPKSLLSTKKAQTSNTALKKTIPRLLLKSLNKKRVIKPLEMNMTFTCEWPGCGRVFKSKPKLSAHRDIHLEVKRYRCDWPGCDDAFLRKRQLISHISAFHTNERPYKCDWPGCDYASNYEKGLSRHRMTHTGEKPYACSWPSCEWTFRQQHHLSAHMLKHTGEKPFDCEHITCDRKFSSRQAMRFHMEKSHKDSVTSNVVDK